jgi:crotonobetainyl-CoA:carnitine CoA-transferase CaiB-like acyl-CoA transferase
LSVAHEDHFWRPLTALLGMQDVEDLKGVERIANAAELRKRIAAKLSTQDLAYWHRAFDERGIPWSPLHSLKQVTQDAHFTSRELFTSVTATDGSTESPSEKSC